MIEENGHYLALDAGVPFKEVQKAIDFNTNQIDALLVTHLHEDHCSAAKAFSKYGIAIFSGREQSDASGLPILVLSEKKYANICGWKILPVTVPHNQTPNFAFLIESPLEHHKVFYLTDFEYLPYTVKGFGINTWLVEVNHMDDVEQFEDSENFEHVLRGHSSLGTVKDILAINQTDSMKNIICCHLSDENSNEKEIVSEIEAIVPDSVQVGIADKGKVFEL